MARRVSILTPAVAIACLLVGAPPGWAAESTATLAVSASQAVTLVGEFPSLKALVEQLCSQAGVELRSFEADDRPVRVSYTDVALTTALAGLLRDESYLVGVSAGQGAAAPRVSWLRVVSRGTEGAVAPSASLPEATPPLPAMAFEVPATFGSMEFTSEDPEQRARALEAVASRLLTKGQLLAVDPNALAATLRQYPHARELLIQLRDGQDDAEIRSRLDAILLLLP